MQPPAPLQPPALHRVTAGDQAGPLPCALATTCGHGAHSKGVFCFARRVFLPEDFRIYTVGRGGLAKSELAHVKVTVPVCCAQHLHRSCGRASGEPCGAETPLQAVPDTALFSPLRCQLEHS